MAKQFCTERTADNPSPTAAATRFMGPARTSPAVNTPRPARVGPVARRPWRRAFESEWRARAVGMFGPPLSEVEAVAVRDAELHRRERGAFADAARW